MLEGTAKLAYEIGESKADGGESRFSGTSLDDMRNNADGIAAAYKLVFEQELTARDPALATATAARIKQLQDRAAADEPGGCRFGQGACNQRRSGAVAAEGGYRAGVGKTLAIGPGPAVTAVTRRVRGPPSTRAYPPFALSRARSVFSSYRTAPHRRSSSSGGSVPHRPRCRASRSSGDPGRTC